jgi:hypothetical protein
MVQVCWLTPVTSLNASSAQAMMHAPDISMTTYSTHHTISTPPRHACCWLAGWLPCCTLLQLLLLLSGT